MKLKIYLPVLALLLCSVTIPISTQNHKTDKRADTIAVIIHHDYFEEAVQIIKDHEGWHSEKHYPLVGYGHKLLKGENFNSNITEEFATELVRKDLRQKCAVFREFGKDSLLLGVLAYNVGEYRLIKSDGTPNSTLIAKLKDGDRAIYSEYISYKKAWGRIIPSIERRRITEFKTLYNKTHVTTRRIEYKDHPISRLK